MQLKVSEGQELLQKDLGLAAVVGGRDEKMQNCSLWRAMVQPLKVDQLDVT